MLLAFEDTHMDLHHGIIDKQWENTNVEFNYKERITKISYTHLSPSHIT